MKKIVSILLLTAMIMSVAGCSQKSDKQDVNSQMTGNTQKEEAEKFTEKESEQTEANSGNENTAGSLEELNAQVEKDIADTLTALTAEYEQLKTDLSTYEQYMGNVAQMEAFYGKVNQTHKELCIRMYEYSVDYAEKILSFDIPNDEKYDQFDELYDNIYDDGGDTIYDDFYDGILEDIYDDFYDGILDDEPDIGEYSEWLDYRSQEYEWWSDTRSEVYEQWSDYRSDVYEFWQDIKSEVFLGDIEKANKVISDFKEDIAKLKEKSAI